MALAFQQPVDIANRAIQHVGARRINLMTDLSKQAKEMNFCYDKLRVAELRRAVWRFATRRVTLHVLTQNTLRFIPPTWLAGTTYVLGDVVQDANGVYWVSKIAANVGNTPGAYTAGTPAKWEQCFLSMFADQYGSTTVYNAGDIVYKSGPIFYIQTNNNVSGNDPAVNTGNVWKTLTGTGNVAPFYPMPVGVSMTVDGLARNIFPLPNGFLRLAAVDPKFAAGSVLATSGGVQDSDWQLEGDYIVSASASNILLRFVGDVSDVTFMDPLFCEGLAARMGYETCETLTQSNVKQQAIAQAYQRFISDARMINAIEIGDTEGREEEYRVTQGPQGVVENVVSPPAGSAPAGA